jgi:hypothetical protein
VDESGGANFPNKVSKVIIITGKRSIGRVVSAQGGGPKLLSVQLMYPICSGNDGASSQVRAVDPYVIIRMLRDSTFNILWLATSYGLEGRGSVPGRGKIFLFSIASSPVLGPTQPTIQWVSRSLSSGLKRPGREADHSPPSTAEVKNGAAYLHYPIGLHGMVLN